MISHSNSVFFAGALALVGCASTPGARPQDMSAAQHEQSAAAHEAEANPHAAQYDPNARAATTKCRGGKGVNEPCWTSTSNPTKEHLEDAEKHKKMAADHRAAAQALRDAEAKACAGISDADRDVSPFDHKEDITGVAPLTDVAHHGKHEGSNTVGATVTFRAVPGLTAEWFQRIVECHVARNNALGNNVPEMAYCPLVPKGVTAKVTSAGNGFSVDIRSDDPETAKEVLRRAQALKPGA
jgi:hypothetical protein